MKHQYKKRFFFGREALFLLIVGLVTAPLVVVFSSWFTPLDDIFFHLSKTDLLPVLGNTAILLLGVAIGTTTLGVSLAWITTRLNFPGQAFFDWAMILPLAIPTYVLAFVNIALFDRTGPIQKFLWAQGGTLLLPPIRSTGGVIIVMTLALYPYVYLFARNGFQSQGTRATEVARSLGQRPLATFFKIDLPMAGPMISSGLILVLMETLSDFGAVSIFNYDTFTTTIYKAWFSMFSLNTAAQYSSLLIPFVFVLILLEQKARQNRRFTTAEKQPTPVGRVVLTGAARTLTSAYCLLIFSFSFIIPVVQLVKGVLADWSQMVDLRFLEFLNQSIILSTCAAFITTLSALTLVFISGPSALRFKTTGLIKLATFGYALPGTILAVGGIILVTFIDHQVKIIFNLTTGFFITGTIFAMLLGYHSRFMALAYNPIESAMHRITPHMHEAARSLGANPFRMFRKIHLPLLRGGLFTGMLLVFVDVMKEMPITLMTRPFGWDTLAIRIFQFTSEGEWDRAALPALTLIGLGFIPVILLIRQPLFRR